MNPPRKLIPVLQKDLKDGIDKPKMILFEDFKNDVTTAARQAKKQTPAQKSHP
ncbi:MAG: hypothetical protein WAK48_06365 [Candidatus Acidiferrum sp.]